MAEYIGRVYVGTIRDIVDALILDGIDADLIDIRDAYYGNYVEIWLRYDLV